MATLSDLETADALVRIEVPLDTGDQPWRRLYGTPEFIKWLDEDLPVLETTVIGGDSEPSEQVDAVMFDFVRGAHLNSDKRFKRLTSTPDYSVWEFKTPDIRIFGWVPMIDTFICCFGDMKDRIELLRSYMTYIARTKYVRDQIPLDEPKSIDGGEYDNVLSDAKQL